MIPGSKKGNGLPADLKEYLPQRTVDTWVKLAPLVPPSGYLAGGTGLTVYLRHRISRDLDFMMAEAEDLSRLRHEIDQRGIVPVEEGLQLFVERYDPPNP